MRSKAIVAAAAIAGLMSGAFAATCYTTVSIGKPGVSLQAGKMESDKHSCEGKNPAKARAAVKVLAFLPRAHLDNAVTEARIPQ